MEIDYKDLEKKLVEHRDSVRKQIEDISITLNDDNKAKLDELSKTVEELGKNLELIQENAKKQTQLAIAGLGDEEKKGKKFDFGKFALAVCRTKEIGQENAWKDAAHEKEVLMEYAKKRNAESVTKDAIAGDGTQGGYLIPEESTSEFVDLAIAKAVVLKMGPTVFRGLVGDLPIPKLTSRNIMYWLG